MCFFNKVLLLMSDNVLLKEVILYKILYLDELYYTFLSYTNLAEKFHRPSYNDQFCSFKSL